MYSPEIIERRLHAVRKSGAVVREHSRDESVGTSQRLERLRFSANGEPLPLGQLQRPLDSAENFFVESERMMCKLDFGYFLSRYHSIELDPGVGTASGIGPAQLLESQEKFIREAGRRELVVHAEYAKYGHTEGIRILAHKCRQVSFTTTSIGMGLHRMLFWPGTRAFTCALDNAGELYKRYKLAIEHLPFWLSPGVLFPDVKDQEIGFPAPINSRLLIQEEGQKHGIGTGTQQDFSHLTEVPLWKYPGQIGYAFLPALPKSRMTLHIQEGTSCGRDGYWNEATEACRARRTGWESWTYIFVPSYLNTKKWRAIPPDSWTPDETTLAHAELIERTSPEFCEGVTFHPSREHLYWWEKERARQAADGKLAHFLANYPATPEESFCNWNEGALPVELIEKLGFEVRDPQVYEVEVAVQ
jgi:hypothetical protein